MPRERKIRLLLADDQEMVRYGVKALLAGTEIEVVAEASTGETAIKFARDKEVDLVLLDVRMPDSDGLTALSRVKLDKPHLPVLLFSAFDNPASIAKAIALGASGFLLRSCTREELLKAIRRVADGENIWSREMVRLATGALRTPGLGGSPDVHLTEREGEVLRRIVLGLSNQQIADTLKIGCETVKEHVQHILRKLDVTNRTQAALWAVRNGLV